MRNLTPGHEYYNFISLQPCGVPGTGPWLGLCASDPSSLLAQFALPVGVVPFHFVTAGTSTSFGPYFGQAGLVADGVCLDITGAVLGCVSPVRRLTLQ